MSKLNIGKEIIDGLEEIKAWHRGKIELKTTERKAFSAEA